MAVSANPFAKRVSANPFGERPSIADIASRQNTDPNISDDAFERAKTLEIYQIKGYDVNEGNLDLWQKELYSQDASHKATNRAIFNQLSVEPKGDLKKTAKVRPSYLLKGAVGRQAVNPVRAFKGKDAFLLWKNSIEMKFDPTDPALMDERKQILKNIEGKSKTEDIIQSHWTDDVPDDVKETMRYKMAEGLGQIPEMAMYLTPITLPFAVAGSYGQMIDEGYQEALAAGKSEEEAVNIAMGYGVIAGTLEVVVDRFTAGVGGDFLSTAGQPLKKKVAKVFAGSQIAGASEFVTETMQSAGLQQATKGEIDWKQATTEGFIGYFVGSVGGNFYGSVNATQDGKTKKFLKEQGFSNEEVLSLTEQLASAKTREEGDVILSQAFEAQAKRVGEFVSNLEGGNRDVTGFDAGPLTTDDLVALRNQPDFEESLEVSEEADLLKKAVLEGDESALAEYNQRLVGIEADPTIETESNGGVRDITITREDSSEIFGAGTEKVTFTDSESGGVLRVIHRPDGVSSVIELFVPEEFRGRRIGSELQRRAQEEFPKLQGQVSSKSAAKTAYELGRRPPGKPNATLEEVFQAIDENSSVNLITTTTPIETESQQAIENVPLNEARNEIGVAPEEIEEGSGWMLDDEATEVDRTRSKFTSQALTPVLQRVKDISPEAYRRMVKFEFDAHQRKRDYQVRATPFLDTMSNMAKISPETFTEVDNALRNGDFKTAEKYVPKEQLDQIRGIFEEIAQSYEEVGIDISRVDNYFTRRVRDYEGLQEFLGKDIKDEIEFAINEQRQKAQDKGYTLSDSEVAQIINQVLSGAYRPVGGRKPRAARQRTIDEVTPDIAPFYYDAIESTMMYMSDAAEIIEMRKFFGKDLKAEGSVVDVNESIGDAIADLQVRENLSPKDVEALKGAIRARFGYRPTHPFFAKYKSLVAMTTLGQVQNAVTQFGDAAWSFYENGIGQTILTGLQQKNVTMEELGIEEVAEEFRTMEGLNGVINTMFKYTGLKKVDKLGKDTLVSASIKEYQNQAKRGKFSRKKQDRLNAVFGEDQQKVINDLKSGEITEDVKFLAFATLLDWQPVTLSNMPEVYLNSPKGRIMYTLKTFTLMQLDNFRRNGIDDIQRGAATGDVKLMARGLGDLMRLAGLFYLANVPIDIIKDMMSGKDFDLSDVLIDNIYKLFGVSRYAAEMETMGGSKPSKILNTILPPAPFLDYPAADAKNIIKNISEGEEIDMMNLESWKMLPVVGRTMYWTVGKGEQKEQEKLDKELKAVLE